MKPDNNKIKARFNRIAPIYDLLEAPMEGLFFKQWRKRLWAKSLGYHILEIGIGTGKNIDYYPEAARITAIDFSPKMILQAEKTKARKNSALEIALMDVQSLAYADNSFDTVIASFVFCSVHHPVKGIKELYRVCKPGGQVVLLEHVISSRPFFAAIMRHINPLIVKLVGANINRDTVKMVKACGFANVNIDERSGDIIKLIAAKK